MLASLVAWLEDPGLTGWLLLGFLFLLVLSSLLVLREGFKRAFVLHVAWRHLKSRTVSWVATSIIVIVVMLYLVFISVLEGFKEHHMQTLRSIHAHMNVRVGNLPWGILKPESWAETLKKADPRIHAVTISLETPAIGLFNQKSRDGKEVIGVGRTVGRLCGIDLPDEIAHGGIQKHLNPAGISDFGVHAAGTKTIHDCILTETLRNAYHIKLGDQVTFLFTDESRDETPCAVALHVVGFLEGLGEFQDQTAYVDRKFLAEKMDVGSSAKTLSIWVEGNPDRADLDEIRTAATKNVLDLIQRDAPHPEDLTDLIQIETWREKYGNFYYAVSRENLIMRFLMAVFLVFVAIIIMLILGRIVAEKTRDIGALRALGASSSSICACFLAQGLLISGLGLGIGLPLALLFVANLNPIEHLFAQISGHHVFPASDFLINEIPTHILPLDVALIIGLTMAAGLCGALLPSLRAARLNPVECLRHE